MTTTLIDLKNTTVAGVTNIPAAAVTGSVTTGATAVDLLTAEGPIHAVVSNGATDFAGLDETYTFAVYESDSSGGAYTAITGATGTVTAANQVLIISTGQRTKRYVKLYMTAVGASTSIVYSGIFLAKKKITGSGGGTVTSTS